MPAQGHDPFRKPPLPAKGRLSAPGAHMIVVPNEDRRRHPVGCSHGVSLFPKAIEYEPLGSGWFPGIHGWTPLLGASKRVGTCVRNSSRGCTPCGPVPDKTGSYPVPCRGPVGIGQHGQVGTCFFFFSDACAAHDAKASPSDAVREPPDPAFPHIRQLFPLENEPKS